MRRLHLPSLRRTALLAAAGGLVLAVAPGAALAQPAEETPVKPEKSQTAPATPSLCPDGSICIWPDRAYQGEVTEISETDAAGCRELARPARSAINDSGRTAVFYAQPGCVGGVVIGIEPGRKAPSFAQAASVRLRTSTPLPSPETPDASGGGTARTAPEAEPAP